MALAAAQLLLLAFAFVVCGLGLWLLVRGLRPKRVGLTPFCRKCSYNLTGVDLTAKEIRCPECGAHLCSLNAVVFGTRRRRPGRIVLGLLLIMVGATPAVLTTSQVLSGVNWYRWKPTDWVLADLGSRNRTVSNKAASELSRRVSAEELSPEEASRAADVCLAIQKRTSANLHTLGPVLDLLGALYEACLLSADQVTSLAENIVLSTIEARNPVVPGNPCPVSVSVADRGPSCGVWAFCEVGDPYLVGERPDRPGSTLLTCGIGRWGTSCSSREEIAIGQPGFHEIAVDVTLRVYDQGRPRGGLHEAPEGLAVVREVRRTLTTRTHVLAEEPRKTIQLRQRPDWDREIPKLIQIVEANVWPPSSSPDAPDRELSLGLEVQGTLPVGLAFEVLAKVNGEWIEIDTFDARPNQSLHHHKSLQMGYPAEPAASVDVLLCSSEAVAVRTVHLHEIWGGALLFRDVPLAYEAPWVRTDRQGLHPVVVPRTAGTTQPAIAE